MKNNEKELKPFEGLRWDEGKINKHCVLKRRRRFISIYV
jgi:hypothetical protein